MSGHHHKMKRAAGNDGAALPSVSYAGFTGSTADANTFTFTDHAIGDADATRLVVVVVHTSYPTSDDIITSVTIGGNAMTKHLSTAAGNPDVAIFSYALASGTTATIVVNLSVTDSRCGIGVFALYDLESNTPVDIDSTADTSSGSKARTLTVEADGITIIGASGNSATSQTPTNYTESYDTDVEVDGFIGGYDVVVSSGSRAYTCTAVMALGCVHWR